MRRRKRLINQTRSPSPLAGSFPVEGREASHFYGKEGPALWPGGCWQTPWRPPQLGWERQAGAAQPRIQPPAISQHGSTSSPVPVSPGTPGDIGCADLSGTPRGRDGCTGAGRGLSSGGWWALGPGAWLNRIIPESPAFKWDPQSRFSFPVT